MIHHFDIIKLAKIILQGKDQKVLTRDAQPAKFSKRILRIFKPLAVGQRARTYAPIFLLKKYECEKSGEVVIKILHG